MEESAKFLCNADPGTRKGRRIQTVLLLTLPSIPVFMLAIVTIVHLAFQARDLVNIKDFRSTLYHSESIIDVILDLHEERAQGFLLLLLDEIDIKDEVESMRFGTLTQHTDNSIEEKDIHIHPSLQSLRNSVFASNISARAMNDLYSDVIDNLRFDLRFPKTHCPKLSENMLSAITSLHEVISAVSSHEEMNFLLIQAALGGNFTDPTLYAVRNKVLKQQLKDADLHTKFIDNTDEYALTGLIPPSLWWEMKAALSNQSLSEYYRIYLNITQSHRYVLFKMVQDGMAKLRSNLCINKFKDKVEAIFAYLVVLLVQVPLFVVISKNAESTKQCLRDVVSVYASRTVELKREKRKSDNLLQEMLPKSVAKQLKFGQKVHAEQYDSATIYFSDIPDFDEISSKSEPMDIVTFLNNVYGFMDAKMNMYDVYKMETIGSVYMVVSGVPLSNGKRHVSEIANLAVDILKVTEDFVIPHMPSRTLQLRIGIHSGEFKAEI